MSRNERVEALPPILLSKSHIFLSNVSYWAAGRWPPGQDQDGKWEGELSNASGSHRSFTLCSGMSVWCSIWRLAPDVSSTRSLNLAAMDMKLVAVN